MYRIGHTSLRVSVKDRQEMITCKYVVGVNQVMNAMLGNGTNVLSQ